MLKITEIRSSSIITKSNLPEADYVINPYVGCMHRCFYCYARFMKRFTNHKEEWGDFVDVKINAPELVPEKTQKYKGKEIFLSSVTDAYHPLEKKYELTRKILQKLISLEPDLCIQTKSDLVLRDIDLIKQFENRRVSFTITTLDDNLRREIEPLASAVENRIKALEKLKENGIPTYVFIGPILPFLTDWKKIVLATKHCADYYMFENLNVSGELWKCTEDWLKKIIQIFWMITKISIFQRAAFGIRWKKKSSNSARNKRLSAQFISIIKNNVWCGSRFKPAP